MKIEEVMKPEFADLDGRVNLRLMPTADYSSFYNGLNEPMSDCGIMSLQLILPLETAICGYDRYKVTVERIENDSD